MDKIFTFIKERSVAFTLLLVGGAMLYGWYHSGTGAPEKQFVAAPVIAKVASVPKEALQIPVVTVYRKEALAKKIDLPAEVKSSPAKQVTATADLAPSKGGYEVLSVIDTQTGDSVILKKEKPQPLFGFENERRLGVGYGVSSRGTQEMKLYGEYGFLRVGNIHASIYAEANKKTDMSSPEAKAYVQTEYRW